MGTHSSYPVYRQVSDTEKSNRYLYRVGGVWLVSDTVGEVGGGLRNRDPVTSILPDTKNWENYDGAGSWLADPSLHCVVGPLPLCGEIVISATGPPASIRSSYLGVFTPTGGMMSGRQVFRREGGGVVRYLSIPPGNVSWMVCDSLDSPAAGIASASGSLCPAHSRAATSTRFNQGSWLYWDNGQWVEGDIQVTCKTHSP